MSRIDEALKRSSRPLTSRGSELTDLPLNQANAPVLDEYPLESRPAATRQVRRADPVAPRPAPAPPGTPSNVETRSCLRLSRDAEGKFVVGSNRNALALEQYRRLAATLHDAQVGRGLKTFVVTSAIPREGKTLTAVNLALTLSESYGRRVLLVDADLRCPRIHEMFGISNDVGLTDVLRAERLERATIHVSPLLTLLPSGKPDPNPQAGLSSARMRQLVDDCAQKFDWVILDTPPLALQSDAQLLARLTQTVVFVIRAGSTPFPVVDRAVTELGRDCIIGTVLNGVDETAVPDGAYYSEYHSDHKS